MSILDAIAAGSLAVLDTAIIPSHERPALPTSKDQQPAFAIHESVKEGQAEEPRAPAGWEATFVLGAGKSEPTGCPRLCRSTARHQIGDRSEACSRFPSTTSFKLFLRIALSPNRGSRG